MSVCIQCGSPFPEGSQCSQGCNRGGYAAPESVVGQQIRGTLPAPGLWRGWSINLSMPGTEYVFPVELPVPPLFDTSMGPVSEIVFWAGLVERWIHGVREHFPQPLPQGHVQVALGDLEWIDQCQTVGGVQDGLRHVVQQLEEMQRGLHSQ